MKKCLKCGGGGPFGMERAAPDGLTRWCKGCRGAAAKASNANPANRARKNATEAVRRKTPEHAAKRRVSRRGYYRRHSEKVKAHSRAWYAANAAKMRVWQRKYYRENPETVRAASRAWDKAHPEQARMNHAAWRHAHHAAVLVAAQRRRDRLAVVEHTLTLQEWQEILVYFNHACAYCLRTDLPLEMDHVIAVSRGGAHTAENVVPACKSDNCRKKDKSVFLMVS